MTTGWAVPTPEDIAGVIGFLVDDNLKRMFFGELENPKWAAPLAELDAFSQLPDAWIDDEGNARTRPWPEGEYLARIAAAEPSLVTEILAQQPDSESPWVSAVLLTAALALPPEYASRLAPKVATAVRRGVAWIDEEGVVRLAESLAERYPVRTRDLLAALFQPRAGNEEITALGSRHQIEAAIDPYWYGELAPRATALLARLGMKGLRLSAGWLISALKITLRGGDGGSFWRPSIAPHEQNSDVDGVADILVDIVRDVAVEVARAASLKEVVDFLDSRGLLMLRRIAIETAAQVLGGGAPVDAIDVARRLLLDESLLDIDVRPEYVHLAVATLPLLSQPDLTAWQVMVEAERWQGPEELIRRIAARWDGDPASVSDDAIAAVRRRMTYRLLLPLEDVLPTEQRSRLTDLRAEFGELEHPEFTSYATSFAGHISVVDSTTLFEMSADDLFSFLRDWKPDDGPAYGPSIEGTARELATATEHRPDLLAALAPRLLELPRAYVKAVLDGWAKAIPTGFDPSYDVWDAATSVARLHNSGVDIEADFDADDPVWRWAQRSAIDFATAHLTHRGTALTRNEAQRIWAVVEPLTTHPDPTPEHEQRYGGDNMDPLTLSLNTTRPAALRAATKLLHQLKENDDAAALRSDILAVLAQHVSPQDDPSLAVAAVLGEALGRLADVDRTWVDARADALFDVLTNNTTIRAHCDVVVSVALRTYRTGRAFIELMRGVVEDMFSAAYASSTHIEGWRNRRAAAAEAASHVLRAYVFGLLAEDDPLIASLTASEAPDNLLGEALGHLGWELMHAARVEDPAGGISSEVLDRAKQLIEHRVEEIRAGRAQPAELTGFYWLVRAELYEPSWSLPILQLAARDPAFDPKGLLGEALSRATVSEPALVLEVFDQLLHRRTDSWKRHDMLRHAPQILAAAIQSDDAAAGGRAHELLDELGREGHLSILNEVDQIIGR